MSYVYIQSEKELWTVGFYDPEGKWHPESDHGSKDEAADRVHWLNGGDPEPEEPSVAETIEQNANAARWHKS